MGIPPQVMMSLLGPYAASLSAQPPAQPQAAPAQKQGIMSSITNPTQGQGMAGLMGNPMLGAAMGLLSASRDDRIDPYQSALGGMYSSAQFGNQQKLMKMRQEEFGLEKKAMENENLSRKQYITQADSALKTIDVDGDGEKSPAELHRAAILKQVHMAPDAKTMGQLMLKASEALMPKGNQANALLQGWDRLKHLGGEGWSPGDQLSPAQQQLLQFKSASNAGYDPEALNRVAGQKARQEFSTAYREERPALRTSVNKLREVLDFSKSAGTGMTGGIRAYNDADLQTLQAMFADIGLDRLGSLPVPLTPMSDPDIKLILSLSGQITNKPEANEKLLNRGIKATQRLESDMDSAQRWYANGGDAIKNPDSLYATQLQARISKGLDIPTKADEAPKLQSGGIPTPNTEAEYDELPSGAIFIDPDDGQQYRKP